MKKLLIAGVCCCALTASACQDGAQCGGILCSLLSLTGRVVNSALSILVCDGSCGRRCDDGSRSYWVSGHWEDRIDPFGRVYSVYVPGRWYRR